MMTAIACRDMTGALSRKVATVLLAGLMMAALLPSGVQWAWADTMGAGGTMPTPTGRASAIFDGSYAYTFGGIASNKIIRYDPVNRTFRTMTATVPSPTAFTSAVWTGYFAYIFGGGDVYTGGSSRILRYDPFTDQITRMNATIPGGTAGSAAAFDGRYVYVFGGRTSTGVSDLIHRYDTFSDTTTTMSARLVQKAFGLAAAFDGTHVYLFGGESNYNMMSDRIQRYSPASDTIQGMSAKLPSPRSETVAVWDGRDIYLAGGVTQRPDYYNNYYAYAAGDISRYDVNLDTINYLEQYLDPYRGGIAGVWTGKYVVLMGGYETEVDCYGYGSCSWGDVPKSEVLRYSLEPAAPTGLSATPTQTPGQWILRWAGPRYTSYSPNSSILFYRIYRSAIGQPRSLLDEVDGTYATYYYDYCPIGQVCVYNVTAVNERGESPLSTFTAAVGTSVYY